MTDSNVAILVDSTCDIAPGIMADYGMYSVPLLVNYPDASFLDRVDITPRDIVDRLPELPSTSTPTAASVVKAFEQIKADGHSKVLAFTLSSGLSGTYNLFKSVAMGISDMVIDVVDTKTLSLGAAMMATRTAQLLREGLTFGEVRSLMPKIVENTRVWFTVDTLEYLHRGGRLSKASYTMGSMLDIRPIITSSEEGTLVPVAKTRGRKQSLKKMIKLAKEKAAGFSRYNLAVAHTDAEKEMADFREMVIEELPDYNRIFETEIGPVLFTHCGPGVLGVGVQGIA